MTNSPAYDQQLALNEYWKQLGGNVMLPGTNRAADGFARASFYINAAQQSDNAREAAAAVFSVMRNVSVPRGISTAGQPNISSSIWRTVADQKNKVYCFEDTGNPRVLWIDLKADDLSQDREYESSRCTNTRNLAATRPRTSSQQRSLRFWLRSNVPSAMD